MYGFKAEGGVIKDAGRVPIIVRDIQVTVTFTRAGLKAVALDAKGKVEGVTGGAVMLVKDALHMVVTR